MRASSSSVALATAIVVAVAGVMTACQVLVGFQVEPPLDASITPADAGGDADEPLLDPCGPIPPRGSGTAVDDRIKIRPLVFAAYVWGVETPPGHPDVCPQPGFNMDSLDTGPPGVCTENASCKTNASTIPVTQLSGCDDVDGIDNQALRIIQFARESAGGSITAMGSVDPQPVLTRGASNILIELTSYNGTDRDDSVTVSFYGSAGLLGVESDGLGIQDIKQLPEVWDGGQADAAWVVGETSVENGGTYTPPRYSYPGYVRGGLLVVPYMLVGFGPPSIFALRPEATSAGRFMAKIVRKGDKFELTHGRIGTTIINSTLLAGVGRINYSGTQLCDPKQELSYQYFRNGACGALDMPPDGGPADPTQPCERLSLAFSIAAVESAFARDEDGALKLGKGFTSYVIEPCSDDAGSVWCDDCSWPGPRRCDAGR